MLNKETRTPPAHG